MKMKESQFLLIKEQLKKLTAKECFYKHKLEGVNVNQIQPQEDFEKLPFIWKGDLRETYPLGLMATPEEKIVRIHSSSGVTGTSVIIPHTQKDADDWALMFARCYEMVDITNLNRIQITSGCGLWTAGIGFQLETERPGAMTVPMGPGNTDKQLCMMMDMKPTVLCAISSHALLSAEEIAKRGIGERIHLRKGVIGSERWGEKMRNRITAELGVDLFDIYGLTEVYGPGIAVNCEKQGAVHYWDDYIHIEIVDPKTGEVLPDGEVGETAITTLKKEDAPLIRYRTHDLSRIVSGDCLCGSPYPRIGTLIRRTDGMIKVKGVNIFFSQIEELLSSIERASSEYQVTVDHLMGKDALTLSVETNPSINKYALEIEIQNQLKGRIGLTLMVKLVELGELSRSEKKSARVFDNRY